MGNVDAFIQELEHEAIGTRKELERVPAEKLDWAPHPKSFTMGKLASHLAELPKFILPIAQGNELNFATASWRPFAGANGEELASHFDQGMAAAVAAMKGLSDENLMEDWTLRAGEKVIFTMPRIAAMRAMVLKHIVHHRAQLGVYLRINDVPVPAIYGPSADEQTM